MIKSQDLEIEVSKFFEALGYDLLDIVQLANCLQVYPKSGYILQYEKGSKIIRSCENNEHLEVAMAWVNLVEYSKLKETLNDSIALKRQFVNVSIAQRAADQLDDVDWED